MFLSRTMLCTLAVTLFAHPAIGGDSRPWLGTWKLNRQKSSMVGDTYTVSRSEGMYQMDDGALRYRFRDDGQKYPTLPGSTVSVKRVAEGEWLETREEGGKETSRTTKKLSPDGEELILHRAGSQPDGSSFSENMTDHRIGAGRGLVGKWKRVQRSSDQAETLVYSDAGNGAMRMTSLADKSVLVTKLDGRAVPIEGTDASVKVSMSVEAISPRSYTWTIFVNGKPYNQGVNTLSDDGKSFKEWNWIVGKPKERYTVVYERQ